MSRIDAPVYLIPLPLLAALTWLSAQSSAERRMLLRLYGLFLVGAIPVAVLATLDVQDRAGHYYDDLHSQVRQLQLGLFLSTIAGVLLLVLWPLRQPASPPGDGTPPITPGRIAVLAGCVLVLGMVGAWAIRPAIMHFSGAPNALVAPLQKGAGLPVEPTRTYAELSVVWLSWYLGPVTIALAIFGAAVMLSRIVQQPDASYCLMLAVAGIEHRALLVEPVDIPRPDLGQPSIRPGGHASVRPSRLLRDRCACRVDVAPERRAGVSFSPGHRGCDSGGLSARDDNPRTGFFAWSRATSPASRPPVVPPAPDAAILTAADDVLSQELVGALRSWCNVPVAIMTRPFSMAEISISPRNGRRTDGNSG